MHGVLKWQCKKIQNTHLEVDFSLVNFEIVFLHKSIYWPKTSKNSFFFPHPLVQYNVSFVWFGLGWRGDPFKFVANLECVFECLPAFVTCKRSITFELPLKGILNIYMNRPVFPPKCLQFMDDSLMEYLEYFDILIH